MDLIDSEQNRFTQLVPRWFTLFFQNDVKRDAEMSSDYSGAHCFSFRCAICFAKATLHQTNALTSFALPKILSSEWRRVDVDAERHNEVADFWKTSWFFFLWFGFFLFECAKQKERNEQGKDAGMRLIDSETSSDYSGAHCFSFCLFVARK